MYRELNEDTEERYRRVEAGHQRIFNIIAECRLNGGNLFHRRILVFTGPKGSGKDTACANPLLAKQRSYDGRSFFQRVPMAGPIKESCRILYGLTIEECEDAALKERPLDRWPWHSPRKFLQDEANHQRDVYGSDFHVRNWCRAVSASDAECIVVTDLRFPEELEVFLGLGAQIVWVHRQAAQDRLDAQVRVADPLATNVSESHWDLIRRCCHWEISNNGTFKATEGTVNQLVAALWRDPIYWESKYVAR